MTKFFLTSLVASMGLFSGAAYASAPTHLSSTGYGVQIGTYNALTLRQTTSERNAWDLAVGAHNTEVVASGDYLWYIPNIQVVNPYIGIGGGVGYETDPADDEDEFAVIGRIPLGVSYYPQDTNIQASFQLTPMFRTLGEDDLAANISVLYHFQ